MMYKLNWNYINQLSILKSDILVFFNILSFCYGYFYLKGCYGKGTNKFFRLIVIGVKEEGVIIAIIVEVEKNNFMLIITILLLEGNVYYDMVYYFIFK